MIFSTNARNFIKLLVAEKKATVKKINDYANNYKEVLQMCLEDLGLKGEVIYSAGSDVSIRGWIVVEPTYSTLDPYCYAFYPMNKDGNRSENAQVIHPALKNGSLEEKLNILTYMFTSDPIHKK